MSFHLQDSVNHLEDCIGVFSQMVERVLSEHKKVYRIVWYLAILETTLDIFATKIQDYRQKL